MEDSTREATLVRVDEKVDSFYEGDLEHAAEVLSALWGIVNKDGDITTPSSASPAVSRSLFWPSPSVILDAHLEQPGRAGHESCPLGLREDRTHRLNSQRRPLRQEVLG